MPANRLLGFPPKFPARLVFSAFFFAVAASFATTLVPLRLEDLTRESDLVVVGNIATISRTMDGKEHRGFTYVTVTIAETWKGRPSGSVTLKILGGQTGEDPAKTRIPGAPSFVPGWNYLLFLAARPEEDGRFYNVTGWTQGRLEMDAAGRSRDGRSLRDLREEVERHLKNPKPRRLGAAARKTGQSAPASSSFKKILAPRVEKTKLREIRSQEGDPSRPVTLTPRERQKLRDAKTGGGW